MSSGASSSSRLPERIRFAAFCVFMVGGTAYAATWRIEPGLRGSLQWTDNVNLVATDRKSDWVTEITPTLVFAGKGAEASVTGSISAPVLLYANTGGSNNRILPQANIVGSATLYPQFLFVDASVQVSQDFISPFAPRPQNFVSNTANRYTAQSYRISPFIKGESHGNLQYELRDTNLWTNATNVSLTGDRAYTNEIVGHLTRDPRPLGWGVNYDRVDTQFNAQDSFVTEIGRLNALWQPDPQLQFSLGGGYEDNRFQFDTFSGATYGGGFKWRPSSRTSVDVDAEHRFFGASYHVLLLHRAPRSIWTLRASRDITTYPQNLATLPDQGNVAALLDSLFSSRLTDPAARQAFVQQLIRERGLPATLTGPLDIFNQQVTLQESFEGTVNLIGVRNAVLLTAYRRRTEPIPGSTQVLVDLLSTLQTNNTQYGSTVVWTYRLTPLYTLATSADWFRTDANDESGLQSKQATLQVALTAPLTKVTSVYAGARYQRFTSNLQSPIEESAVFVGINHIFR